MPDYDPEAWTKSLIADMRAHGGRPSEASGWAAGKPFVILTTKGAKSGQQRLAITTYHKDGNRWVIAASKGGADEHPQWYYNLKANPQCEFGDEPFIATEVTDPDEYTRLYGLAEKVYAGWSDYLEKTAAAGRTIPVFRLVAR